LLSKVKPNRYVVIISAWALAGISLSLYHASMQTVQSYFIHCKNVHKGYMYLTNQDGCKLHHLYVYRIVMVDMSNNILTISTCISYRKKYMYMYNYTGQAEMREKDGGAEHDQLTWCKRHLVERGEERKAMLECECLCVSEW